MAKRKKTTEQTTLHGTFRLNGKFLKREAKEAIKGYFAPFSGVYAAATGRKEIMVHDRDGRIRTSETRAETKKRA